MSQSMVIKIRKSYGKGNLFESFHGRIFCLKMPDYLLFSFGGCLAIFFVFSRYLYLVV